MEVPAIRSDETGGIRWRRETLNQRAAMREHPIIVALPADIQGLHAEGPPKTGSDGSRIGGQPKGRHGFDSGISGQPSSLIPRRGNIV